MQSMKRAGLLLGLLTVCLVSGCSASPTFLVPASPIASQETALFWIVFDLSVVVFVVVEGLLLYNVIRRQKNAPGPEAEEGQGRAGLLEIIYTVIPVIIVVVIFLLMAQHHAGRGRAAAGGRRPATAGGRAPVVVGIRLSRSEYQDCQRAAHSRSDTTVQISRELGGRHPQFLGAAAAAARRTSSPA